MADLQLVTEPVPQLAPAAIPQEFFRFGFPLEAAEGAARRPWISDRWRGFHLVEREGKDMLGLTRRWHWTFRRRRNRR